MNHIDRGRFGCAAVMALLAAACSSGGAIGDSAPTASGPPITSMAELEQRLAELDTRLEANPDDPNVQRELAFVRHEADRINGIVATIDIAPGHSVRFYSPSRGVAVVSESHHAEHTPVLDEHSIAPGGLAALHESLSPGEPVPQALIDLDRQAAEDPASVETPSSHAAAQGESGGGAALETVQKHGTNSCTHFRDHGGCPNLGDSRDFRYCLCDHEGGGYAVAPAVRSFQRLGLFGGASVTARGKVGNTTIYTDIVAGGEFWAWWMHSPGGSGPDERCNGCGIWACNVQVWCRRDHRFDVLDASGNRFHFGGLMDYSAY